MQVVHAELATRQAGQAKVLVVYLALEEQPVAVRYAVELPAVAVAEQLVALVVAVEQPVALAHAKTEVAHQYLLQVEA